MRAVDQHESDLNRLSEGGTIAEPSVELEALLSERDTLRSELEEARQASQNRSVSDREAHDAMAAQLRHFRSVAEKTRERHAQELQDLRDYARQERDRLVEDMDERLREESTLDPSEKEKKLRAQTKDLKGRLKEVGGELEALRQQAITNAENYEGQIEELRAELEAAPTESDGAEISEELREQVREALAARKSEQRKVAQLERSIERNEKDSQRQLERMQKDY
jgi:hypothetical protein